MDAVLIPPPKLDPTLYSLNADELEFFKDETGIRDDDALKAHILAVQAEAYNVYPYQCIRVFTFARLKISRLPSYPDLLRLGRERKGAIFIDFGCCFGNDARKAVADGYPIENVMASDLRQEFWNLGHRLFKSTPETFPVSFVAGDIFDEAHIKPTSPSSTPPLTPAPPLSTLTSLTPLQGHVSAIHTSAFFHLFDEAGQLKAARALASLLSPEPGSMIFGEHTALPEGNAGTRRNPRGVEIFCHSPRSWTDLWDGIVFEKGSVSIDAQLREVVRKDLAHIYASGAKFYRIVWCVKRL